jgi:Spy/CpxP family protein refolding chaperone
MKKQFLTIAILFIACLLSVQAAKAQQGFGSGSGIPELKEAQRKTLLAILAESKKKAEPWFTTIVDNRAEIEQNYISEKLDKAALQKHGAAFTEAMCKLLTLRLDTAIQMMKLLTPEQKRFVVQMIEESGYEKDAYRVLLDAYNLPDFAQ